MLHAIFAHGWEDRAYLAARCENVGRAAGRRSRPSRPSGSPRVTGVPAAAIVEAARLLRDHAARLPRLRARRHAARLRHRERDRALQPGARDRPRRRRRRRHQPAARPEQRAGRVRHGRAARRATRATSRWRDAAGARALRGGVAETRAAERARAHDARHAARRARRSRCAACSSWARIRSSPIPAQHVVQRALARARLPDRRRALPHRDREAGGRRPAGRELRREGRDLHLDRAPRAARAPRGRAAGRRRAPTGRSWRRSRRGSAGRWASPSAEQIFAEMARAHADLRRHELRAARTAGGLQWPCPGRDASRERRSCTASASRAAAAA